MKKCTKCKKIKSLDRFYKRYKDKEDLASWCKDCLTELSRMPHRKKYNTQWRLKTGYDKKGFARIRRNVKQRTLMAVRRGDLIKKPCPKCGKKKVEGHHHDYNKPFEVLWLCNKHHRQLHSIKEAMNEKTPA